MNHKAVILAIGVLPFGCAIWFCDSFFVRLAFVGVTFFGVMGAFFGAIFLFISKRAGRSWESAGSFFKGVAVMIALAGVAVALNQWAETYAVNAAKAYPERIAPLLEEYRNVHGSYPASLDQIPTKPAVPRLLRGAHCYQSEGDTYFFTFGDPGSFFDGWTYDHKSGHWELSS